MNNYLSNSIIMTVSCKDSIGILSQITSFVADHLGNFTEVDQYTDGDRFLSRFSFDIKPPFNLEIIKENFTQMGKKLKANWEIIPKNQPIKTILLVSNQDHCLADILWRYKHKEINLDIKSVIANHKEIGDIVERDNIPFKYIPIYKNNKNEGFQKIDEIIQKEKAELIILCRYMQIIPPWMCNKYKNSIINIHHSLLPSFIGADPYKKAYERGVKLIGATCHYATPELDSGPIIHQETIPVEHFHSPEDLKRLGRDCERIALAKGVRLHSEKRVLVHNKRTIIFGG